MRNKVADGYGLRLRNMKSLRTAIVCLMFFAIVTGSVFTQNGRSRIDPKLAKEIQSYLQKLEEVGFSGTVLVEVDGEKVISKGYGHSNAAQKIRNAPHTIFDIGSVTKQFTGAAILKLEMQGKVSTADKITKYFVDVPSDKSEITIHQLLRHSSGLPSNVGGDYEAITESDFVDKVMKSTLRFPSGTDFSYSNIGYSLLAMIVEKAAGQTYEAFLQENLWKPAK